MIRIAIKIGTSTLTYPPGNLDIRRVGQLCPQTPTKDIPTKQAAAAVGQCALIIRRELSN